jgi:hypothetical protein
MELSTPPRIFLYLLRYPAGADSVLTILRRIYSRRGFRVFGGATRPGGWRSGPKLPRGPKQSPWWRSNVGLWTADHRTNRSAAEKAYGSARIGLRPTGEASVGMYLPIFWRLPYERR